MSSTESLRRDHNLIEKALRALSVTADMLAQGKQVPAQILNQSIDFTKNFMLVCHHGKEEETLFPTLEQHGMPKEGGPIARMIYEHGVSKELAAKVEASATQYLQTSDASQLVSDIRSYVEHVGAHLNKENLRLFVMADMILKSSATEVGTELERKEKSKLEGLGRSREQFERLVDGISSSAGGQ